MNNRTNGTVYRGQAIYYTFQRLSTGLSYLDRLEDRGKDLKEFTVVYTRDGEEKTVTAPKFRSWASGLKDLNGTASKKAAPAKKSPAKKRVSRKAAAAEQEPQEA